MTGTYANGFEDLDAVTVSLDASSGATGWVARYAPGPFWNTGVVDSVATKGGVFVAANVGVTNDDGSIFAGTRLVRYQTS